MPRAHEFLARIAEALDPLLAEAPPWLHDANQAATEQWGRGQGALRVEVTDTAGAREQERVEPATPRWIEHTA